MSVEIKNLTYVYSPRSPYQKKALDNISLTIADGDFFGIVGHTGSGKSTLVGHLNAITRVQKIKYKENGELKRTNPDAKLVVNGIDLTVKKPDLAKLRRTVGMVFQYPEHQLFADTVYEDVAFGAKNMGAPASEIEPLVKSAITAVGLNYEEIKDRSPFEISGGQKRRVAIAGVIVMKPKMLILDEPTVGLDPKGVKDIIALIKSLKATCPTIIMISHNMDEVAACCTKVAALDGGKIAAVLTPSELFKNRKTVTDMGLELPAVTRLALELKNRGMDAGDVLTENELINNILSIVAVKK